MIGFRVDANEKIATGHMMRCIAIAKECMKRGEQCLFLMAEKKEEERLISRGIPYEILHSKWNDLESELPVLKTIVKERKLDWLVVDSYQATPSYLQQLNEIVPVLYIDDMAKDIYQVSALLHYGVCADLKEYQERYVDLGSSLLAGIEYTPLREEFIGLEDVYKRDTSILITTGGTDPYNITGKLLSFCIKQSEFQNYEFQVIVGSMNEYEEELKEIALQYPRIHLHKNVNNISEFMCQCQMAVSAGGTTLLELCACGTPTVCFSFADNQVEGASILGEKQIMLYAGDVRVDSDISQEIIKQLLVLAKDSCLRSEYADKMQKLVDGKGVYRIADMLCSKRGEIPF